MNRTSRRLSGVALGVVSAGLAVPAWAGPPFATDDPAPTDKGHWEIYSFASAEGRSGSFDGTAGFDLNYGPVPGVQLTATLPATFADSGPVRLGNIELGVKYRFFHRPKSGISAAIFPRVILPSGPDAGSSSWLLPVWLQKDIGKWSVFGGGGYTLHPGPANRNYATGGIAVTREVRDGLSLGVEALRQGPDGVGARARTLFGFGGGVHLKGPLSLIASAGPTIDDGGETRWRGYVALALDY
jgi:hypothetical protein